MPSLPVAGVHHPMVAAPLAVRHLDTGPRRVVQWYGRSAVTGQTALGDSCFGGRPKKLRNRRARRITKRSTKMTMSAETPHSG